MRQQVSFICDHCGGLVWVDAEGVKHYEMSCLICGRRSYIKKHIFWKVVERKLKESGKKTKPGGLLFIS